MNIKLGSAILNAAKKAYPILTNGETAINKKIIFSTKNPYILEVLPENKITELAKLEGKKLDTVCRILDAEDSCRILNRYYGIINSSKKGGFSEKELKLLYKKAFPKTKVPWDINNDAMIYLARLSESIGSKFDAHGLAKISVTDQLQQLNRLLTNGIDKNRIFYTAPLVSPKGAGAALGTAGGAYRDGSFILVSDKSKFLAEDGIKHVIVNDAYYSIIGDLQKKFPNVNFVRADKAVEYFSKL